MNPLISFLIPTFDGALHIKAALDSLIGQVGVLPKADYEIVVCINGSEDETAAILSKYKNVESLKVLKFEINLGYDKNIIRAMKETKGKFIWFLGDDDILLPNSVSTIVKIIKRNDNICTLVLEPVFFIQDTDLDDLTYSSSLQLFNDSEKFVKAAGWNGSALSSLIIRRPNEISAFEEVSELSANWIHLFFLFGHVLESNPNRDYKFAVISKGTVAVRVSNPRWEKNNGNYVVVGIRHLEVLSRILKKDAPYIYKIFFDLRYKTNWSDITTGYKKQDTRNHLNFVKSQISLFWSEPFFWAAVVPLLLCPVFLRGRIIKVQKFIYMRTFKVFDSKVYGA